MYLMERLLLSSNAAGINKGKLWNNLPQSLTEISNIDNFKLQLEHYLYPLPLV